MSDNSGCLTALVFFGLLYVMLFGLPVNVNLVLKDCNAKEATK